MVNFFQLLCAEYHKANVHWWTDPATGQRINRDKRLMLLLVVSELIEAAEGERKSLMDDHLPHRPMAEVEMADACIRLFDYIGGHSYDLDTAFRRAYPSLNASQFNIPALCEFFNQRFFRGSDHRGAQIMQMISTVCRVDELEAGGSPARDVESQLAWLFMLIFDYCGLWGYDLWGAICEKHAYNAKRADHTNAARLAKGGKKW